MFCPSWLPDPFTGRSSATELGGGGGPSISVINTDRSYLMGFIWLEPRSGEVHVNLRGYPGRTKVPTCIYRGLQRRQVDQEKVPCFDDAAARARRGITATVYTVNQDADLWHVLYAWHYRGGLYTLSEHVAAPLTYAKVVANLDRMMRGLVVVEPSVLTCG